MTWLMRQLRRADGPAGKARDVTYPHDDLLPSRTDLTGRRADCCSAEAGYRVLLRGVTAGSGGELMFCGHHLRSHRVALRARHAVVFDAHDHLVAP